MSKRTKLLLKENNELEMQIQNKDNKQVLTDITVYIRSANISPYYQEKVRRDILEMIVDGEKRDETAREVIGENYRSFCNNVIAEIPKLSRREHIFSVLRDTLFTVDILLIIWLIFNLIGEISSDNSLPYFTVTAGNVVCGIVCIIAAFFVFSAISKNAFNHSAVFKHKAFGVLLFMTLICMCANIYIKYTLLQVHAFVVVGGIVIVFVLYKILDVKLD